MRPNHGDFGRSSDPWVSWAPNGDLWSISLSVDQTTTRNAVLAARMAHGSSTWSEPFVLKFDTKAGFPPSALPPVRREAARPGN